MMHLVKYIGVSLTLALIAGCGPNKVSLSHQPRLLHFIMPEASGGLGKSNTLISVATQEPTYIFGTLDSSNSTSTNAITSLEESTTTDTKNFNVALSVGLLEYLDFYVDSKAIIGLKYQLLGSPQTSKESGVKLAVSAQLGKIYQSDREDNTFVSSPVANANSETKLMDISAIAGYRYSPKNLGYVNTFINTTELSGTLWIDNSGINRTITAKGKTFGLLMGYQYTTDADTFFTLETGITRTIWDTRGSVNATPIGVSYGGNW